MKGANVAERWDFWTSNGTEAGTTKVRNLNVSRGTVHAICNFKEDLIYSLVYDGGTPVIWRLVRTAVSQIDNLEIDSFNGPIVSLAQFGENCLIFAQVDEGLSLFKSNGEARNCDLVKRWPSNVACQAGLTIAGGIAYFVLKTSDAETEVWRTDGTPDGTVPLKVFDVPPHHLIGFRNGLVFVGQKGRKPKKSK